MDRVKILFIARMEMLGTIRRMKYYLLILASLLVLNCQKDSNQPVDKVTLITKNQALINNFSQAHQKADSLVKKIIDLKNLDDFVVGYGFDYQNWEKRVEDTLTELPLAYKFYYGLKYEGDTIGSAIIELDTTLKMAYIGAAKLFGMKGFLTQELKVGPKQAAVIAQRQGVDTAKASIIFKAGDATDAQYYWEVKSDCDGCKYLRINAKNGDIVSEGKMIIRY